MSLVNNKLCGCLECIQSYEQHYEQASSKGWQDFSQNDPVCDADADIAGYVNDTPPVDQFLNENLHLVWFGHFKKRFQELQKMYNHQWILQPTITEEGHFEKNITICNSRQLAKVRFICEDCGKTWTSMRGVSLFTASQTPYLNVFALRYVLYGQKCSNPACKDGDFQNSIWYPEEVIKVVDSVFNEINSKIYGQYSTVKPTMRRVGLRLGRPQHSHETANCQACAQGICPAARRSRTKGGQGNNSFDRNRLISNGRQREDSFSSGVSSLAATSASESDVYSVCVSPDVSSDSIKPDHNQIVDSTPVTNRMAVVDRMNYSREMC